MPDELNLDLAVRRARRNFHTPIEDGGKTVAFIISPEDERAFQWFADQYNVNRVIAALKEDLDPLEMEGIREIVTCRGMGAMLDDDESS